MLPLERPEPGAGDHLTHNRAAWDSWAADYVKPGETAWAAEEPTRGIWSIPESEVHLLPDDLAGKDAVELGCGTAYVSAWLARRGARPAGIDLSGEQLAIARRLQRDFFGMHRFEWPAEPEVEFHLGHGDWIRLLLRNGLAVEDLLELRPRAGASTLFTDMVTLDWARRWPCEEVWKARKHP